jgi:hypothetical protein
MGVVAPLMHGDLGLLAWISLGGSLIAWICWRAGCSLRQRQP